MKWIPSQFGAEPKKLAVLGGLAVVLVAVYFINRNPDVPQPPAPARPAVTGPAPLKPLPARPASKSAPLPPQRSAGARQGDAAIQDFKPTLKLPEGADVSRIDPSLRLDLMAQLQQLPMEGGERSLFEFGAPPKPKTPTPVVEPVKPQSPAAAAAAAAAAETPVTPPKPVVPPIPLKFYGYVNESQGPSKRAFFLDGEDIVVAGENDVIRNRFKVVRIGVNSATVEDTTTKNQQTLPLIEELQG